jgi:glutathione S-transferase
MILEFAGGQYKNVIVGTDWPTLKADQKFGHIPRLSIKSSDNSVKYLWESAAIEEYLSEKFGLLPSSPFERAESMSIVYSLYELKDKVTATVNLPTAEERGKAHHTHCTETIPKHLKWHEAILERSGGVYYNGDKVTLPDLALTALFLRYRDMYGDENPINATHVPKITHLVKTLLDGKIGEWAKLRRDQG